MRCHDSKNVRVKKQSCNSKTVWIFDKSSNFFGPIDNFEMEKFTFDKKEYLNSKVEFYSKSEKEDINPVSNKLATESSINFDKGFIATEKNQIYFFL